MGRTRKRQTKSINIPQQQNQQRKNVSIDSSCASFMNDDEKWSIKPKSTNNTNFNHDKQQQQQQQQESGEGSLSSSSSRLFYSSLRGRKSLKLYATTTSTNNNNNNPKLVSIPMLLYQRQICPSNHHNRIKSKELFLMEETNDNNNANSSNSSKNHQKKKQKRVKHSNIHSMNSININNPRQKRQWKSSMKRIIPFSKLNTPFNDAILGIDYTGSFLISIADGKRVGMNNHNDGGGVYEEEYDDDNYNNDHGRDGVVVHAVGASFGDGTWVDNNHHEFDQRSINRYSRRTTSTQKQFHDPSLSLRFYGEYMYVYFLFLFLLRFVIMNLFFNILYVYPSLYINNISS